MRRQKVDCSLSNYSHLQSARGHSGMSAQTLRLRIFAASTGRSSSSTTDRRTGPRSGAGARSAVQIPAFVMSGSRRRACCPGGTGVWRRPRAICSRLSMTTSRPRPAGLAPSTPVSRTRRWPWSAVRVCRTTMSSRRNGSRSSGIPHLTAGEPRLLEPHRPRPGRIDIDSHYI